MSRKQRPAPTMEEANRQLYRAAGVAHKLATIDLIFWSIAAVFFGLFGLAVLGLIIWAAVIIL